MISYKMKVTWNNNDEYLHGQTKNFEFKSKLAIFDLDNTIITTKSGKTFPTNENDWKFLYENTVELLQDLNERDYSVIIVSNQGGIDAKKQTAESWTNKLNDIVKDLAIDICIFCSCGSNHWRKPSPNIFQRLILEKCDDVNYKKSFYCGDAAGRKYNSKTKKDDFTDTDYKFALNCNLIFKTPEQLFCDEEHEFPIPPKITTLYDSLYKKCKNPKFIPAKNEMIIMVGFQGSGKSTIAQQISNDHGYTIINQDTLKTLKKCMSEAEKIMKDKTNNNSIIIDATNPSKSGRGEWIKLAQKHKYNVRICVLTTDIIISQHNNLYRGYCKQSKPIPELAYRMYKSKFEKPNIDEGVDDVILMNPSKPSDKAWDYYFN